jgi:hypothetical protein
VERKLQLLVQWEVSQLLQVQRTIALEKLERMMAWILEPMTLVR